MQPRQKPESASAPEAKARLAIVSPFLDKTHGTERIIAEWIARLAPEFEIHLYCQHVEDVDLRAVTWHRIPKIPGPHLVNFLWWFSANHLWRLWNRRVHGLRHDIVFSPGINCLDADVISVHIVFEEFLRRMRPELRLARNPIRFWPRLLHRCLYYGLVAALERQVYADRQVVLIYVARKTASQVERLFGRQRESLTLYAGIDHSIFNLSRRLELRHESRERLGIAPSHFVLLLIGNDWRNKGIRVLLDALSIIHDLPIHLLLVGDEDPAPFRSMIANAKVDSKVRFLPPRRDVEFYYAAADAYVAPSLEDAFALPPAEAMACGLPVIVSSRAGVSEVVTHGSDGFILDDPQDAVSLAAFIRQLSEDPALCDRLGEKAAQTTNSLTWESNARELAALFERIVDQKSRIRSQTIAQEL